MRIILFFLTFFISSIFTTIFACEILFTVAGQHKDVYQVDEELILKVEIILTHRVCPVAMKDTKFTYEGVKVLGATEWKEETPGKFTRKIKLKVENDGKENIKLTALRTCEKDGGYGSITLAKK